MSSSGIAESAVNTLMAQERARFLATHPRSLALAERAVGSLVGGVPMHWMADWSTPCPLFVDQAQGARFVDVDGLEYIDFCLGDTGAMFGHSPPPSPARWRDKRRVGSRRCCPARMRWWRRNCSPRASACRCGR